MRLALDTNRYTDLMRGEPPVVQILEQADSVCLPLPVLAELRAGFLGGAHARHNEQVLRRFLRRPGVSVVSPDDGTTSCYASIYQQLRRQGTPIPTNDLWIAAIVIQHGLTLFTRDAHFEHLAQLARL